MVDYYRILGIARDASARDINTAYKKLALKYHPDKSDNTDESLAHFRQIQEAIEVLRDPVRKRKYDSTQPRFEWEKRVHNIYNMYDYYNDSKDAWATWDSEDPAYQEFAAWEEARYKQTWYGEEEGEDENTMHSQQQQQQEEEEEEEEKEDWHEPQKDWRQRRAEAMRARIIRDEEDLLNTDEDEAEIFSKIPLYEWHENGSTTTEKDVDLLRTPKNDSHLDSYPLIDLSDPSEDDRPSGKFSNGIQELLGDDGWFDNDYIEAVPVDQQTTSQDPYEQLSRFFEYKLSSGRYHQEDMQAEIIGLYLESMQQSFMELQLHHMDDNATSNQGFHKCHHLGPWEKHLGAEKCDVCGRWRPLYTMSCPVCNVKACVGCKYERNNEELI